MNFEYPPKSWYRACKDIISESLKGTYYEDFKRAIKLRPFEVDTSSEYIANVFKHLVDLKVVQVIDNRIRLNKLDNLPWFTEALLHGDLESWELANLVENDTKTQFKFDSDRLAEIGLIGENFVIKKLKEELIQELHCQIKHISLIDDSIGYDIKSPSVHNSDKVELLEIKTSTRVHQKYFEFFLSRNEYITGLKNPSWSIVAVQIKNGNPTILGHIKSHQIESRMPKNIDKTATWESVRLKLDFNIWNNFLP